MPDEPLSPVVVERKLRQLVNDLTRAQLVLAEARDSEVEAKHAYEAAHRAAILSEDCPKVTRGGYTTAERDAFVAEKAAPQQRAHDIAEARRKAAEDHLRVLRDQAMVVATLAKSVHLAYQMSGRD